MYREITKGQLENLEETRSFGNKKEFNDLLEEYTGIEARPYTGYQYYDSAGNFVGDSDNNDVRELLDHAYITVRENDDEEKLEHCCCDCEHNIRKKTEEHGIECSCEIDGHHIGYVACFTDCCEHWKESVEDAE